MKLILTIEPLLTFLDEKEIVDRITRGLGLKSPVVAKLRLDRALEGRTTSLGKDLLLQLCLIARDYEIGLDKLLLTQDRSVFDLLPKDRTVTYIGSQGPVAEESGHYDGPVTTSVWDFRSARRFAHSITRDFAKLRYAPPPTLPQSQIERHVQNDLEGLTNCREPYSILSIGSAKSSTMSEWLMASALDVPPFTRPPQTRRLPFEFRFPVPAELLREWTGPRERATAKFVSSDETRHAALSWEGAKSSFTYQPPEQTAPDVSPRRRGRRPAPKTSDVGRDYAAVLVQAFDGQRANVVVAGLSGTGTFGASALLCRQPDWFPLPGISSFVVAFLVEIATAKRDRLRTPTRARVLHYWPHASYREKPDVPSGWYTFPST